MSASNSADTQAKAPPSRKITWQQSRISPAQRSTALGQTAVTVWMTGLPASGKSTLAFQLEQRLLAWGHPAYVLDGDNVRHGLCSDLGFSACDRNENIRRVAEVARLFNDAGIVLIAAFISPLKINREMARRIVGADRFVEAWVCTDVGICEQRDPKGLYRLARTGALPEFTGVSAPYEPPVAPEVALDTGVLDVEQCLARLLEVVLPKLRNP